MPRVAMHHDDPNALEVALMRGPSGLRRGWVIGVALVLARPAQAQVGVSSHPGRSAIEILPPSHRRFWSRVADPEGEPAARAYALVQRLMVRAGFSSSDGTVESGSAQRLYRAVLAIAQLSGVHARASGELGYFVGRALLELNQADAAEAWISAALEECSESALSFAGWLDRSTIHAQRGEHDLELEDLTHAQARARSATEKALVHRARGSAFERLGAIERARTEYLAWLALDVTEDSLAYAGWRLALVLDRSSHPEEAMRVIDEAEARAYARISAGSVAIDSPGFRHSSPMMKAYADGMKHLWLSRKAGVELRVTIGRAIAAFELVLPELSGPERQRLLLRIQRLRQQ